MLAGTRARAFRVEFRTVIERDCVLRMRGAEDMSTVATMMAALEEGEGLLTCCSIAQDRVRVGFPMGTSGEAFNGAQDYVS